MPCPGGTAPNAHSFSRFRHFARLFWNQTWGGKLSLIINIQFLITVLQKFNSSQPSCLIAMDANLQLESIQASKFAFWKCGQTIILLRKWEFWPQPPGQKFGEKSSLVGKINLFSIRVSTNSDSAKSGVKTPKLWYFKQFGHIAILKGLCHDSLSDFKYLKDVFNPWKHKNNCSGCFTALRLSSFSHWSTFLSSHRCESDRVFGPESTLNGSFRKNVSQILFSCSKKCITHK